MADVLLVCPPVLEETVWDRTPVMNLGLGYLSAFLRKEKFSVEILDAYMEDISVSETVKKIRKMSFKILGFHVGSLQLFRALREIMKALSAMKKKKIFIVIGGHYATLNYAEILKTYPEIDCIVLGEGEETLLELCRKVLQSENWKMIKGIAYNERGKIIKNYPKKLIENLDLLPYPTRYDISTPNFSLPIPISTSRGCYGNCSFCTIPLFYKNFSIGKCWRGRTAESIIEEIHFLQRQYGCSNFYFTDDNFFSPMEIENMRCKLLVSLLRSRRIKIGFSIYCRPSDVVRNKSLLIELKQLGLHTVILGMESGLHRVLKLYRKGTKIEDNVESVKILTRLGLLTGISFIFFDPYMSYSEIKDNILFLKKLKQLNKYLMFHRPFTRLLVDNNTQIKFKLEQDGLLTGSPLEGFSFYFKDLKVERIWCIWEKYFWKQPNLLSPMLPILANIAKGRNERINKTISSNLFLIVNAWLGFLYIDALEYLYHLFEINDPLKNQSLLEADWVQRINQRIRKFVEILKIYTPDIKNMATEKNILCNKRKD